MENAGPGSRGTEYGVRGPGVRGPWVWKTRGLVENAGSKWKTRGLVENAGSGGKCGVYVENTGSKRKTRGKRFFEEI